MRKDATTPPKRPAAGEIQGDGCYPLDEFRRRTGLADAALRSARRAGLKVRRWGGRGFILGDDFFEFLRTHGDGEASK